MFFQMLNGIFLFHFFVEAFIWKFGDPYESPRCEATLPRSGFVQCARSTNLSESGISDSMVVFMVRGKDIRHVGKLERRAHSQRPPGVTPKPKAAVAKDEDDSDASLRDVVRGSRQRS